MLAGAVVKRLPEIREREIDRIETRNETRNIHFSKRKIHIINTPNIQIVILSLFHAYIHARDCLRTDKIFRAAIGSDDSAIVPLLYFKSYAAKSLIGLV